MTRHACWRRHNLESVTRSDSERRSIALGWLAARALGQSQEEYARTCGVAPRTLRAYLRRWPNDPVAVERRARAVLERAVAQLQALLRALDASPADRPEPEPPSVSPAARACLPAPDPMIADDAVAARMPVPSPCEPPVPFPNRSSQVTSGRDHTEEKVASRFSWI